MKKFIVITTINPESEGISKFKSLDGWHIILVGDKKTSPIKPSKNMTFLSVEDQLALKYNILEVCPYNHYARKNIGYLYAIQNGAEIIYDTDDDNLPYDDWGVEYFKCERKYTSNKKYINIYSYFSDQLIWPRGYPLDEIHAAAEVRIEETEPIEIGVWQGMADLDPDVDAIYRMTISKEIIFEQKPPVALFKGHYCPFNSQNTSWNEKVFPYLYLPAKTSFRFTDIFRSYVAQRLIWEEDLHVGYTKATVYQKRNEHNLMKDFIQEIECYINVKPIVELLDSLECGPDQLANLLSAYKLLSEHKYIDTDELIVLQAWINDFKRLKG